jgi:hypothetical protein
VPCAVNEAGNPGAHLEASPAGASAAAAAIAAVKQEPHESSDCEVIVNPRILDRQFQYSCGACVYMYCFILINIPINQYSCGACVYMYCVILIICVDIDDVSTHEH